MTPAIARAASLSSTLAGFSGILYSVAFVIVAVIIVVPLLFAAAKSEEPKLAGRQRVDVVRCAAVFGLIGIRTASFSVGFVLVLV